MNQVLLLGGTPEADAARKTCGEMGLAPRRAGCFGPGRRLAVLIDVPAFRRLHRACGSLALASAAEWLLVVGGPVQSVADLAAVSAANGVFVPADDPSLLRLVLRRILSGEPPGPQTAGPMWLPESRA